MLKHQHNILAGYWKLPMLFASVLLFGLSNSVYATSPLPDSIAKDIKGGYFHRALNQLQPLKTTLADNPEFQYELGEALLGTHKLDDAETALKAAIKLAPDNGSYYRALGDAYGSEAMQASIFSKFGLAKDSLHAYQKGVQLAPANADAHVSLAMYYIIAPGIVGGSTDKAHEQEAILAKLDPVQALQVRGQEAESNKDAKQAEVLFKQAAVQDKSTDSLMDLGYFYTQQKRYPDAIKAFQHATDKDASDYMAWYQIGRVAAVGHTDYAQGIAAFKHYLGVADLPDNVPPTAWAHFRLGNLYEDQGNKKQAQAEYQLADKLKGDDRSLAALLDKKL